MPLIYVNAPAGAITEMHRDQLAEELTSIALDAEHLPSTPFVKSTTWIYFNDYPVSHVYSGGKCGGTSVISLEVNAFEGGLSDEDKVTLISHFTSAIEKHTKIRTSSDSVIPVYIIIRDINDRNWGVFGDRIQLNDLRNPPVDAKPV